MPSTYPGNHAAPLHTPNDIANNFRTGTGKQNNKTESRARVNRSGTRLFRSGLFTAVAFSFLLAGLVITKNASAVNGTFTVGPTGTYSSLTAAIVAINGAGGADGPIILELQSTYVSSVETFPINPTITGNSATNKITIRPETGATNLIITSADLNSTIYMNGAANVTFDGRPGGLGTVKQLTISNTSTVTSGTAVRFVNEASNNTIKYAVLKSTFSSGTTGVITFNTSSGANGNDNNTIDNCDIDGGAGAIASPTSGTARNGIFSQGTTTSATHNNSGNTISNCNIFNNFSTGAAATSAGILLGVGNTDWTISGNSIYQTATRTATLGPATVYGISINNSASGNNFIVSGNFVGGTGPNASGTPWTINGAFANRFNAIGLNVGDATASSIQGNTVANFSFASTSSATANNSGTPLATGVWGGIFVGAGSANVGTTTGNTIGSGTGTGSITVTVSSNPGATANGMGVSGVGNVNFSNNTVGSITTSGGSGTLSTGIIGINSNASGFVTISNNTIGSTTTANSLNASLASTGTTPQIVIGIKNTGGSNFSVTNNTIANLNNAYNPSAANANNIMSGIATSNGLVTITGNTVRNLTAAANANGVGAASSVQGIQNTSTGDPLTITGNTVRSIANNHTTGATVVLGIYNIGQFGQFLGPNIIARNFIHSLTNLSTAGFMNGIDVPGGLATYRNNMIVLGNGLTNSVLINGVNETGGTNNFYHNSIYVGGTNVVSGSTPTNAFTSITTGTRNYRNNIFVNARSNTSGTGKHYAVRLGGASLNPAGLTTNNNVYLSTGTGGVFGFFNGFDRLNLADWQTATGQDINSFASDPKFLAPTAATPDLHINPSVATVIEGNGSDVGVTDDFDTDLRVNFTPVDIGADAGIFTSAGDFAIPTISYTTLPNTASTSNRTLTISITDASGVPTAGVGLPRLYFRKGVSGAYATTQCLFVSGSSYDCTFDYSLVTGGSVAVGNAIQYYVVAQDAAATPNVGASPSAGAFGFTANPPAVATPPTTPNSYSISPALTGAYSVCDGGTYPTLKSFFDTINAGVVTGNITVNILGPCSETSTASLNQWLEEPASSNFTMLIQPGGGGARTVTGNINGALIKLNGADRVTIDGLNTGGNSLALTNNNTSGYGIWLASLGLSAGATNNTIQNIDITGNSTDTVYGSGVDVSGSFISSPGADNDGNTIQGNTITKFGRGITVNGDGITSAGGVDGLLVANNMVGPATAGANNIAGVGIGINGAVAPSIIRNTVRNVVTTSFGQPAVGISLLFVTNAVVTENTVSDLSASGSDAFAFGIVVHEGALGTQVSRNQITGVVTTNVGGESAKGIYVNTETVASNVTVANNFVSDIQSASGTNTDFLRQPVGIYLDGDTGGINLYSNSVNLAGSHPGASGVTLQAALFVNSAVTALDIRDNIFANSYDNSSSATDKSYAIYSLAPPSSFTNIDFNDYYASGTSGVLGFLASERTTIGDWRTATGQDLGSLSADPQFLSATDLHITRTTPGTPSAIENVGTAIGAVTDDIDGDTRDASTPDIGADEVSTMQFSSATYTVAENVGGGLVTITVTRTDGTTNAATINYATSAGPGTTPGAGPGCAGGDDYITTSGTLNFAAGETSQTFDIEICDDGAVESSETVNISLSAATGGSIIGSPDTAILTITDDDVVMPTETDVAVSGGNLVISDANGGSTADTLTIFRNGADLRINDPNNVLSAGAGATQVDPYTVDVPFASITGNIQVDTLAGDDSLNVDQSSGDVIPDGGLSYAGGDPISGPGDKLIITCGTQGDVTYNYTNLHDGSIVMSNYGTITYTGLEPIVNDGDADNIIFNLPAGPNNATLADDGLGGNGMSRLSGGTFETTDFWNPTGSVTINRGNAADTLAVNDLPDFNASLTTGTAANPFASLTFGGAVGLTTDKNLTGDASGIVSLTAAGMISTAGTGTVSLTTARNINLVGAASISVEDGNLTLQANQQVVPTSGNFRGIFLNGGTLTTSGTGNISLKGKGGADAATPGHHGVTLNPGAVVQSTSVAAGAGTITIEGIGATGTVSNRGVEVFAGTVTSVEGDISLTGTGGTGGATNYGVSIINSGVVSSTGAAKITFNGTGGSGTNGSVGSRISGEDTQVTSAGGDITVTGQGGTGSSGGHHGASIAFGSLVSGTNGAQIIVNGTGGSGTTSNLGIVVSLFAPVSLAPTTITSDSGDISFTGTGGSGGLANIGFNIDQTATVIATGPANITIDGTGGTGTTDNYGVGFEGADQPGTGASAEDGDITITGVATDPTGAEMDGVRFEDSVGAQAVLLTTTGTGEVTITGTGAGDDASSAGINIVDDCTMSFSGATNTFIADTMDFGNSGVSVNAGANALTLRQKTNGIVIDLGGADSATQLGLTDAELDLITAGTLNIGDVNSGAINVSASISRAAATILNFVSEANIDIAGGSVDSNGGNVTLTPVTYVFPSNSGVDVTTSVSTTLAIASNKTLQIDIDNATVDSGYTQLSVAGLIDITDVNLSFAGSMHTPVAGETFVIVNNDSTDAITGTFAGLNEGDTIANFLGSSLSATITYTGGSDSNDVVLTVNAPAACVAPAIVYVDDDWALATPGTDPDAGGLATDFGCDSFATIQGGVGGVATGGTVVVYSGTYNGPQILISRSMTVTGAGAATTIIDGLGVSAPSAGLVHIETPLGDTGNVSFTGFTITNPGIVSGLRYPMFAKPLDPLTTVTVSNNKILGVNAASPNFDLGIYIYRNRGAVVFDHNEISNNSGNGVLIEQPLNSTDVHHNTISGTAANGSYFNMTYGSENVASLQRVANNTINGPLATAINFNTAPTFLTNPADRFGKFTNVEIRDNVISNLGVGRSGIALLNDTTDTTGALGAIENPVITGNDITGTDAGTSNGIRFRGLVTNATVKSNDIRDVARGFFGEVTNTHSATGTAIHVNNIVGNASGVTWNGPVSLNAENNWWGCNAGPGNVGCDSVTGIVDFNPWLVLGVSASPNPIAPGGTSTVTADLTRNSLGADTSGLGTVPPTTVAFTATEGSMSSASETTAAGQASSMFTSTSSNSGSGCAMVDNQFLCTPIAVVTPVTVSLPHVTGPAGSNISVPITVGDLTGKSVKSYTFQITFDSTRVQPLAVPYDTAGTISSGMTVTYDISNSGHLILSASQATDLIGSGTLIKVLFNIVGSPGQSTPTTFEDYTDPSTVFHPGFRFNAGAPVANTSNGSIHVNGPTAADGTVSGRIVDSSGRPVEGAAIRLTGSQNRLAVTDREGNYLFDNVETNGFYTVTPGRANFVFSPAARSFSQLGSNTEAVFTAADIASGLNPLDTTEYFVRQQYLDFLGREPDESGLAFWVNNIDRCGSDTECRAVKRNDTSAAFFLSIEFQQTGYLVHRMYQSAYGDIPGAPVPVKLNEFKQDKEKIGAGVVVNQRGWEAKLEANTLAFASQFVLRTRFTSIYPVALSPTEFVDRLFRNGGVTPAESDREGAVNEFGSAPDTSDAAARARVLRRVADNPAIRQQEFSQAFVLMQYFGYLERDPNTGADADFTGYNFWLSKLDSFRGDYRQAEMVKAFLVAGEYRGRFPR